MLKWVGTALVWARFGVGIVEDPMVEDDPKDTFDGSYSRRAACHTNRLTRSISKCINY
jgi:hypothetical protein